MVGSRARTIGNPDLAGAHDQELAPHKLVSMLLQHGIEVFDLRLQRSAREAEEDDAGVGEALVEDQLAEVAIRNYQNTPLVASDREDILVSETMGMVLGNGGDVMAKLAKMHNETKISALVEEEFHMGVASDRTPFGGLGETSSPVTIAFA